ncbi:hypothetical protein [Mesorhizobium sp. IMUNJ 23232]|uniref:hypothetical protein n=1 Tax=Mesorhizobium sp. IMUNJ 23232 TaxID=3376064 RepID=UPI0037B84414
MVETRVYFDTDVDISETEGAFVPFPPWEFGDDLFAAHMIGTGYAALSPDDEAEAYGALYDWSGNGNHLNALNDLASLLGEWGVTAAVVGNEANTTYTLAQIWAACDGGFSIIALATAAATAKTVALVRSGTDVTDPSIGLTLGLNGSNDMRVQATGGGAAQTAQIGDLTTELGNHAYYCGVYTTAERRGYSKRKGEATKVAAPSAVAVTALNANVPLEFADEAGSGTGATVMSSFCIVLRPITQEEFEAAVDGNIEWHAVAGTGLDA